MKPILVIQTAFLGDLALSIPLLKGLKSKYPTSPLWLLCRKNTGQWLKDFKIVDRIFEVDKADKSSWKETIRTLKRFQYESIYCPHRSLRSALLVSKLKSSKKVGFREPLWGQLVFNKKIKWDGLIPDAARQASLFAEESTDIKKAITELRSILNQSPHLQLEQSSNNNIQPHKSLSLQVLYEEKKESQIILAPGSVWATKRWTISGYKEIAQKAISANLDVLIVGSENESYLAEEITKSVPKAQNTCGRLSLTDLIRVMSKSSVVVTNDSGAMHLAAAAGTPIVAIFGPTTLNLGYRPWSDKSVVVQNNDIKCRPCGKHGHQRCPIGTHECMTSISSASVWEQVSRFLPQPNLSR